MVIDTNVTAPVNVTEFLCHIYVLNGLVDSLYNVYCKTKTAKELWESLERKYKTKDDGTKKFVVARFLDYKMVDSKNVITKVQDLQVLLHDIHAEGKSDSKAKGKGKKKNNKKGKGKAEYLAPKAGTVKQKFQGTCYNCDQPGHRAANCKMPKRVNPHQANMVNDNMDMIDMVSDVISMISKVNMVGSNNSGWWVDTGATHHMCADKKIRKNLVSGWLLNKFGFRLVFESDKFFLSKNQMYVGKGYALNGMFKLNVMVVMNNINTINSLAYLIESSNVWHGRLSHVNFNSMRCLIKFNSIPNFHIDSKYKRETCVETKLTRSSFKSVKQKTEPLDMIHTDICDLKSLPTKGDNKYFITFIDDCTKYCYVYLLKSKDEAIDKFVLYKTKVENQLGRKIKVVRSDRRDKYVSPFVELCAKHGIRYEFTAPYSPQQNGIAERKNRTLKEIVNARLDGEVVQDKRQRDDNDLHDERQYQLEEEEKMKADGTIDKYKERLVIKGYRQREGLDYFDTYSPVTRITSIKMVLAIAALRNLEVHQMDVKTAFLNEDLKKEIYMNQPDSFIALGQESKVCRLVKSLYGLKQAPKQWHQKFDHTMLESGFKINKCDKCVYVKDTSTRHDLAYAVSRLSRYTSNPSDAHWKAMTRVLHYLRYIRDYGLHYDRYPAVIEGYSDANWISDIKDSRLTIGYVFTLGGAVISYNSSKQTIIAKSTMESKFIALDKFKEEAEWLRQS
nr:Pol polyprotein [Tanacetum cinerariifolium]